MIRTILTLIPPIIFLYLLCPVLLIESILGHFYPKAMSKSSLKLVQGVFRIMLFTSGVKLTVNGREKIPDDQPVLYVANHRSYYDILIGYTLIKGECGFISKKEINKIPFLGIWMKHLHCLFLDRDNPRQGLTTILTGIDQIKNGISMWIFPEGTRTPGDEMLPFKEGSLKLASKSNCPIIPVTFTNTENILENHMPFIRKTAVTVTFGDPIETADMSRDEKKNLASLCQEIIRNTLEEQASGGKKE
jgi:1-acyl-sn-glycerol-3-phosphate acyltransferase